MSDEEDEEDKTVRINMRVRKQPPRARLVCINTEVLGETSRAGMELVYGEVTLGRAPDNVAVVIAEGVSKNHARVVPGEGAWRVEDLGSANGVKVNGERIPGRAWLRNGDAITLGRAVYLYEIEGVDLDPDTLAPPSSDAGAAHQPAPVGAQSDSASPVPDAASTAPPQAPAAAASPAPAAAAESNRAPDAPAAEARVVEPPAPDAQAPDAQVPDARTDSGTLPEDLGGAAASTSDPAGRDSTAPARADSRPSGGGEPSSNGVPIWVWIAIGALVLAGLGYALLG